MPACAVYRVARLVGVGQPSPAGATGFAGRWAGACVGWWQSAAAGAGWGVVVVMAENSKKMLFSVDCIAVAAIELNDTSWCVNSACT